MVEKAFFSAQSIRRHLRLLAALLGLCGVLVGQEAQRILGQRARNAALLGTVLDQDGRAVPDKLMSRLHARILQRGEDFVLEDLGSRNGPRPQLPRSGYRI